MSIGDRPSESVPRECRSGFGATPRCSPSLTAVRPTYGHTAGAGAVSRSPLARGRLRGGPRPFRGVVRLAGGESRPAPPHAGPADSTAVPEVDRVSSPDGAKLPDAADLMSVLDGLPVMLTATE